MLTYFKKMFKWGLSKDPPKTQNHPSFLSKAFLGAIEDVVFWESMWFSLTFVFLVNLVFLVCVYQQINFLGFLFSVCATIAIMDAFETWLKYKHRTGCLRRIANHEGEKLQKILSFFKLWVQKKFADYLFVRDTVPTKAFIIVNIVLMGLFIIGKYISGYMIIYLVCMFICFSKHIIPPLIKTAKKIQQHADSDAELEGLIPDESDVNINLLSIEPEAYVYDEKQSLDYWKPEDVPIEDVSDSSESSSIATNLSTTNKLNTLEKDVQTSDSSDDEYIPHDEPKEQLRSTAEVVSTDNSWSGAAYNTLWNMASAVTSLVHTTQDNKTKNVSRADSSDGFEFIDKNELT